jgi:adenylyl-sulfate kinase
VNNHQNNFEPPTTHSFWVIGLSAAGKSTLARMLFDRFQEHRIPCMVIDGDEVRHVYDDTLGFDEASRRKQTQRIIRLVRWVASQGVVPIVAIMHPYEDDRLGCREVFPNYYEIFLKCSLDVCVERDPKGLYAKALNKEIHNIAGMDIPYEEPRHSDLVLATDRLSKGEMLEAAWAEVKERIDTIPCDYSLSRRIA